MGGGEGGGEPRARAPIQGLCVPSALMIVQTSVTTGASMRGRGAMHASTGRRSPAAGEGDGTAYNLGCQLASNASSHNSLSAATPQQSLERPVSYVCV